MRGFLDAIERAAEDSRVRGLYAHIDGDALGLAKVQGLRDAVQAFRARGKFAIAFSESFGEFGGGTRPYYLATAFDEIWLQPLGAVGLTGLRAESPFLRGLLDRIGIEPSFQHREQYKSAANILTETEMPAPQREELDNLLGAMAGQITHGIAETRHLSESEVQGLIDKGPLFADEAKEAHIVDRIGYRDEALTEAHRRAGSGAEPVIVSMGATAGSGGYYIAAPADKIVAEPATLTGSIGVVAGKLVITELLNKLRVNVETIERGANSGMFSALRDFSPAERQRLDAFLDQTYRGFKAHVAAGRHLSDEAVEAVAKGRVWSGEDAKKNGLVDELGGYAVALRLAREAAKLSPDAPIKLVTFPHQKSTAEIIFDRLLERERDSDAAPSGTLGRAWTALAALTSPLDLLLGGVLEDPGVLRMPPLGEIR